MRKTTLFLAIIFSALYLPQEIFAQAASRTSLEAKLALENSLEKRVRLVLSEALGTEDIIVIISAELQEQEKKAAELLPGIPQQEKMGEASLSTSLTMVKKLSASLIIDKSVSEEDTQLARKLAAGLLGLPADRQDLVTVEKMDFRKTRPLTVADLFVPPNLWSLVWVVVVALLSIFTVSVFLAPLSKSARAFVEAFSARNTAPTESGERSERQEEAKETAAASAAARETPPQQAVDGHKPPFWFLGPAHLSSLAFIMKTRPVEDLTIVLSYAPGDFAAKLAEALYPKSAEALAALPKVTLMPETRIRALESELRSSLDYVVGGEEKALGIISGLDEAVQEKALAAFGKLDPALAQRLNSSIVRLADLQNLDPLHAQTLARRIPMRVLAAALKGTSYAREFISKLAGGMQERLQQELDLTRDLPAEAYKADRAKVVETLRQLIKEGFITLKPQGAAAPKPGVIPPLAAGAKAELPGLSALPGSKTSALPTLGGDTKKTEDKPLPGLSPLPDLSPLPGLKPSALTPLPGANPPAADAKPTLPASKP